jgi:hypothetical protein
VPLWSAPLLGRRTGGADHADRCFSWLDSSFLSRCLDLFISFGFSCCSGGAAVLDSALLWKKAGLDLSRSVSCVATTKDHLFWRVSLAPVADLLSSQVPICFFSSSFELRA